MEQTNLITEHTNIQTNQEYTCPLRKQANLTFKSQKNNIKKYLHLSQTFTSFLQREFTAITARTSLDAFGSLSAPED